MSAKYKCQYFTISSKIVAYIIPGIPDHTDQYYILCTRKSAQPMSDQVNDRNKKT